MAKQTAKEYSSGLPAGTVDEVKPEIAVIAPKDEEFSGLYADRETGEKFALAIHEPDCYYRTHSLKNTTRFFQCTEAEFRQRFDIVKS